MNQNNQLKTTKEWTKKTQIKRTNWSIKAIKLKPDPIRLIQWKIKERENNQNQLERSEEKQSKNNKEKKNQT